MQHFKTILVSLNSCCLGPEYQVGNSEGFQNDYSEKNELRNVFNFL